MARILLVDDDDSLRKMLRMGLERKSHIVIEARDGNEALGLCRRELPELVLTDLVMPEKEGLETIQEIHQEFPRLPIIAMSGGGRNSPQKYLTLASHFGAVQVLMKPFSNQELADAIEAVLNGPGRKLPEG